MSIVFASAQESFGLSFNGITAEQSYIRVPISISKGASGDSFRAYCDVDYKTSGEEAPAVFQGVMSFESGHLTLAEEDFQGTTMTVLKFKTSLAETHQEDGKVTCAINMPLNQSPLKIQSGSDYVSYTASPAIPSFPFTASVAASAAVASTFDFSVQFMAYSPNIGSVKLVLANPSFATFIPTVCTLIETTSNGAVTIAPPQIIGFVTHLAGNNILDIGHTTLSKAFTEGNTYILKCPSALKYSAAAYDQKSQTPRAVLGGGSLVSAPGASPVQLPWARAIPLRDCKVHTNDPVCRKYIPSDGDDSGTSDDTGSDVPDCETDPAYCETSGHTGYTTSLFIISAVFMSTVASILF